jgi:glycosyltransferase involved in cell wall biosynthesis
LIDPARASRLKVALVMVAVGDLAGSGGAEREFSHLFEYLAARDPGRTTLITAAVSVRRLQQAGRLTSSAGVIALPLGSAPAQSRLGIAWLTVTLLWTTLLGRFDVVHLCLPTPSYVPYAAVLTRLPRALRPRLVLTVIDCTVAHNLLDGTAADRYEQQVVDAHRMYFRWTRVDGVYTWYREFATAARSHGWFPAGAVIAAARYCFTDHARFRPAANKENVVVFAGRLSSQKRPLLFVEAIASLRSRYPDLSSDWRFEMYGGGVLEPDVRARIEAHGLQNVLRLSRAPDLSPVFERTRLFVSTQAYENFTSLAMLEAMAAGNAVIAEDVGQTAEFVRSGENGWVVSPATPDQFADAIAKYMADPARFAALGAASRVIATEIHTIENFAEDITSFWHAVAAA